MEHWFLGLLAAVFLIGTNALGVVMVLAMLFLPTATILPWSRRIPHAMVGAMVLSFLFLLGGFILSVECNLPLSQSVGGLGFVLLLVSHSLAWLLQ